MPNEVFAEDIEALLERLEGISAARVVATDAGDIDRIYLTASPRYDPTAVRRTVATALMSSYSLLLDGWRIRVARLEADGVNPRPWRVYRLEDVRTATGVRVTVELRGEQNPESRNIGSAQGSGDPATRLRTAAAATLDALKSSLEAEGTRASVESIGAMVLAGCETAVVAVSLSGPTAPPEMLVGAALIGTSDIEAVIEATLDAIGKRNPVREQRRTAMKDRREQLESMRAHYRQIRGPQRPMPVVAPPTPSEPLPADDAADSAPEPTEVRPERSGGAAVAPREPVRSEGDRPRGGPRSSIDDDFFRQLITAGTPIDIRCRDGYQISGAVLKGVATYTLIVATKHGDELLFKHGIISIRAQAKAPSAE